MSLTDELLTAAHKGDIASMRRLLDAGADINARGDDDYWNPLHLAIEHDQLEVVRLLIERGADIEFIEHDSTPLAHAVDLSADANNQRNGKPGDEATEVIELLLNAGAMLNPGLETARAYLCSKLIKLLSDYHPAS